MPLELCEEIDGALKHVNTAVQQLRFLAKQVCSLPGLLRIAPCRHVALLRRSGGQVMRP